MHSARYIKGQRVFFLSLLFSYMKFFLRALNKTIPFCRGSTAVVKTHAAVRRVPPACGCKSAQGPKAQRGCPAGPAATEHPVRTQLPALAAPQRRASARNSVTPATSWTENCTRFAPEISNGVGTVNPADMRHHSDIGNCNTATLKHSPLFLGLDAAQIRCPSK